MPKVQKLFLSGSYYIYLDADKNTTPEDLTGFYSQLLYFTA